MIDMGVKNPKFWLGRKHYETAILTLKQMNRCQSPGLFYEVLLAVATQMVECVTKFHSSYVPMGADELLPSLAFLIVKANIAHVVSNANFMADYIASSELAGINGYFCATFQSAMAVIEDLQGLRISSSTDDSSVSSSPASIRMTLASRPNTPDQARRTTKNEKE